MTFRCVVFVSLLSRSVILLVQLTGSYASSREGGGTEGTEGTEGTDAYLRTTLSPGSDVWRRTRGSVSVWTDVPLTDAPTAPEICYVSPYQITVTPCFHWSLMSFNSTAVNDTIILGFVFSGSGATSNTRRRRAVLSCRSLTQQSMLGSLQTEYGWNTHGLFVQDLACWKLISGGKEGALD